MFREHAFWEKNYVRRVVIAMAFAFSFLVFLMVKNAAADEDEYTPKLYPKGKVYQLHPKNSGYDYTESNLLKDDEMLPFGRKYAGDFYLTGDNIQEKYRLNEKAYATSGKIAFHYSYDGFLSDKPKKEWQLYDDGQEKVKDYSLDKDVGEGTVIVEKSYDGVVWKKEKDYEDIFGDKTGMYNIYETNEEDVKHGIYYRVTVAYTIVKGKIGDRNFEECIEVYTFYVGLEQSSLHICDVFTGTDITHQDARVRDGFTVMSDSPFSTIFVKEPGGYEYSVPEYSVYTQKGEYSVKLRTAFGDDYNYKVYITDGIDMKEIDSVIYETNSSYGSPKEVTNAVGSRNMTSLFVEQFNGHSINQTEYDGLQAISVDGESVALYLQLNYGETLGDGWLLASDSYGNESKHKIADVKTGPVETGALIIKTSKDGKTWEVLERGRYKDGLLTTDFYNCYGGGRRIQIYTPNGNEVLNGLYVKVIYAFEVKKNKESKNIIEEYTFYLSNSNTDAVVFHNKSVEGELQEILSEEDQTTLDIYQKAESLADNTQTLSGFSIDISQNPTVKYEVRRNDQSMVGSTNTFTESGKYQITLNAVGETKKVTIYVDRDTSMESLEKYFGDGFLSGKRVYAETGYPVYVGGQTTYNILKVPETMLPVSGKITNLSTGEEITIDATRIAKSGDITEPGEYEAKFYTNKTFLSESPVGDTKVFTFHFIVINEKDVPGPVVNEQLLEEYAKTNISDLCPRYYGLTYPSAGRGYITCAFATYDDAYQYACDHERGAVEPQEDGSYRYNGSCLITQKEVYESSWELEEAIAFFAKQMVNEYYFDMSEEFSYVTLDQQILEREDNLRTLPLSYSVIVFAPGQKEKLLVADGLPLISPKKYAILQEETDQTYIKRGGFNDLEFVEDKYNFDSQKIVIRDSQGKSFPISYHEGVGEQLQNASCASGIVNILELNKYDDMNEYEAVFLRDRENLATVTFVIYDGDKETNVVVDMNSETRSFQSSAFRPLSIVDETDKYSYIKISHNGKSECMLPDDVKDGLKIFSEPGDYTVRCINRLGYSFEFTITIPDGPKFALIRCSDDKGEVKEVRTTQGSRDVRLPEYIRTGYELIGYLDSEGNHYPLVLAEVGFSGSLALEAEWQAKDCLVVVKDKNGKFVLNIPTKFGEKVDLRANLEAIGIVASSFTKDGSPIENGILEVNSEGETVVVAVIDGKGGTKAIVYILIGAIAIIGMAVTVVMVKKGGKHAQIK